MSTIKTGCIVPQLLDPLNAGACWSMIETVPKQARPATGMSADATILQKIGVDMPEEIGLFEAMHTQRAIRHFKPDPVPDELITKILEAAIRAPNAANTQNWAFMVVKDAETRRKIADYYRMAPAPNPDELPQPQRRIYREANEFAQRLHEVPVFIIPCIVHDGSSPSNPAFGRGSFIFPAVQNILLAARGLGLGSILTGRHTTFDKEVKEILGIPDNVDTAALLPIGYIADGHGYGATRRRALKEVVFTDRWGNNWGG